MTDATASSSAFAQGVPSMIVPIILNEIRDYLEEKLQDDISASDPSRAVIVKVGRFQDNPVKKNVLIAISGGDYEDPDYMDGRADHESMKQCGFVRNLPVGEIGGGIYWWRRGTIDFRTFYVKQRYEEDAAMQYAYEFYGRLLERLEECTIRKTDSFGERAYGKPYVEGSSFFESGGKNQYIWRGKLKWRVLTSRP